jgi:hypothetical protein
MTSPIQIQKVITRHDLHTFVKFPWRVYKGDPNWVPPLISERLDYLNPEKNPFYQQAEVALFLARRGRESVGTIAPFIDESANEYSNPNSFASPMQPAVAAESPFARLASRAGRKR